MYVVCRNALELMCQRHARNIEKLRHTLSLQVEHLSQVHQMLMTPLIQQTVASQAFDAYTWACEALPDILPARCGHHALQAHLNGKPCVLIVAGRQGGAWQPTAFAVSYEGNSETNSNFVLTAVQSDCQTALNLIESAVCMAGQSLLVCGGQIEACESNQIWVGELICGMEGLNGTGLNVCSAELGAPCLALLNASLPMSSSCEGEPTLTWSEIPIDGTSFCGRCQHTMSYDCLTHTAIVYGGYSVSEGHLGDVWVIDLHQRQTWKPLDHGEVPCARRAHTANLIESKLWIFGGSCDSGVLGDTHYLDLKTWQWSKVRHIYLQLCSVGNRRSYKQYTQVMLHDCTG